MELLCLAIRSSCASSSSANADQANQQQRGGKRVQRHCASQQLVPQCLVSQIRGDTPVIKQCWLKFQAWLVVYELGRTSRILTGSVGCMWRGHAWPSSERRRRNLKLKTCFGKFPSTVHEPQQGDIRAWGPKHHFFTCGAVSFRRKKVLRSADTSCSTSSWLPNTTASQTHASSHHPQYTPFACKAQKLKK